MQNYISGMKRIIFFISLILSPYILEAQKWISFGIHADPVIGWFKSDVREIRNEGARPGFNFGLTYNKYFANNYSFSTGISILNAGGRLVSKNTTVMEFTNFTSTVLPGDPVIYKIKYLTIPVGLKFETNQIGYTTFFTDVGLDPKVVIAGKADIPSLNIRDENAMRELNRLNLSYHIAFGIEYSLGGNTAWVFGLNYDNNFLDITRDNGGQPYDIITHKLLSFRIGINF